MSITKTLAVLLKREKLRIELTSKEINAFSAINIIDNILNKKT